jgi:hypothetical protein
MTHRTEAHRPLYRNLYLYGIAVLVILALLAAVYVLSPWGKASRQEEVAERGTQVMPFDLERTTHTFTNLPDGGREVVVSDDGDSEQIALIRSHLDKEARRFASGDFSDPARIHGEDMPGLAELEAGASRMEFRYEELPNGAAINYRTSDAALVAALHQWFAAQRGDHGRHAEGSVALEWAVESSVKG